MHPLRRKVQIGLISVVLALIGRSSAEESQEPKIELRVAKYDEMGKVVRDLKGKIVVVDFWQDT